MGWASKLEDERERNDELQAAAGRIDRLWGPSEVTSELHGLQERCERLLAELQEYVELATDPSLDPVRKMIEAERRVELAKEEYHEAIQKLNSDHASAMSMLRDEKGPVNEGLYKEIQEMSEEHARVREGLKNALRRSADKLSCADKEIAQLRQLTELTDEKVNKLTMK